jgi:hypothetical protein
MQITVQKLRTKKHRMVVWAIALFSVLSAEVVREAPGRETLPQARKEEARILRIERTIGDLRIRSELRAG